MFESKDGSVSLKDVVKAWSKNGRNRIPRQPSSSAVHQWKHAAAVAVRPKPVFFTGLKFTEWLFSSAERLQTAAQEEVLHKNN